MKVKNSWDRIIRWLEKNTPGIAETLNPGATLAQIEELELYLDVTFPNSIRDSYLMFNGQRHTALPLFPDFYFWLPLSGIRENWNAYRHLAEKIPFDEFEPDADQAIQARGWHPKWIFITLSLTGDSHCLDFIPTSQGHAGQIIEYIHDLPVLTLTASSFANWLNQYADDLERGEYTYDSDADVIVRKTDMMSSVDHIFIDPS